MFRPFDALAMPNAIEDCLTNAKAGLESHPINNGNRGEMVAVPPPAMKNRGEVVAYCPVRLWTCAHVLTLLPCQRMASSPIDGDGGRAPVKYVTPNHNPFRRLDFLCQQQCHVPSQISSRRPMWDSTSLRLAESKIFCCDWAARIGETNGS
jgi:hypothetical protein